MRTADIVIGDEYAYFRYDRDQPWRVRVTGVKQPRRVISDWSSHTRHDGIAFDYVGNSPGIVTSGVAHPSRIKRTWVEQEPLIAAAEAKAAERRRRHQAAKDAAERIAKYLPADAYTRGWDTGDVEIRIDAADVDALVARLA